MGRLGVRAIGHEDEHADAVADLLGNPTEGFELFGIGAVGLRRVLERPVVRLDGAGKHRAGVAGGLAHRDDPLPGLPEELTDGLAVLAADVDAHLGHHRDRLLADVRDLGPGAGDLVAVTGPRSEHRFGHLRPGRVAGADEEDALHRHRLESTPEARRRRCLAAGASGSRIGAIVPDEQTTGSHSGPGGPAWLSERTRSRPSRPPCSGSS